MILHTQMVILMDGTFAFISNSRPAATECDINHIRNSDLPNLLHSRDCVMLDGVYQGMPFASCIPYRQHRRIMGQPRQELTAGQQNFNAQHKSLRSKIERLIGYLKLKFTILTANFRHEKQ